MMKTKIVKLGRSNFDCLLIVATAAAFALSGCAGNGTTAAPVIRPVGGTYAYNPVLSITDATSGASIYYTIDGSTPTSSSTPYIGSTYVEIVQNATVNAIAIAGGKASPVSTAKYTINLPPAPTPVLSPAPGAFLAAPSVVITDSASTASIYYTTDGSTPTTASNLYTGPITITGVETLQAVAISTAYNYSYSAVSGGEYAVLLPPTFSLAPGVYTTAQQLTMSDNATGASIYYTTDGTAPTSSSKLYAGPITVSSTELVNAIAALTVSGTPATSLETSASYAIHPPGTSVVLSGTAVSGLPVIGATIQLYAVGATGYSSAATPLLTSALVSDSSGAFNLPGKYTCPTGSYVYVTATGGTTTAGQGQNLNLTLAAALGLCGSLTSSSSFTVNEETTVALAYALGQFGKGSAFGQTLLTQPGSVSSMPADNFAVSSTNIPGIGNAMAISGILASPLTGSSGNNSNASATPEWWQVNLIADMLATCVRSVTGSACNTLFGNVVPTGGAAPADTLQAALDLALTPALPATNITNLYGLLSSASSPFTPYPGAASSITDFTIGIEYQPVNGATPVLNQPSGIAIDSLGNAWVGNQPLAGSRSATVASGTTPPSGSFVELTPTGVPIPSATGTFVVNSYTNQTTSTTVNFGGQYGALSATASQNYQAALVPSIDTNNNVWFNDRQKAAIGEILGSGTVYSNAFTYTNGGSANAKAISLGAYAAPANTYVDGANDVWFVMENSVGGGPGNVPAAPITVSGGVGGFTPSSSGASATLNPSNFVSSSGAGNAISSTTTGAYIAVDPLASIDVTTSGTTSTPIPGAPFLWTYGANAEGTGNGTSLLQFFSQPTSGTSTTTQAGQTTLTRIGVGPNLATGSTDSQTAYIYGEKTNFDIADVQDPLTLGTPSATTDYLHFIGASIAGGATAATDWTFDKFGHLWTANGWSPNASASSIPPVNTLNTTATPQINAAISAISINYGSTFIPSGAGTKYPTLSPACTSNGSATSSPIGCVWVTEDPQFTFSVYHNVAGMYDGASNANVVQFLSTDGAGNVWFSLASSPYVNAMTNAGVGLSPAGAATTNGATAGFAGSTCTSCTFNGTTATFARPSQAGINRPAIDQAGNVWIPVGGIAASPAAPTAADNYIDVLVGVAVPKVNPESLGLKNKTFGSQP